MTYERLLYPEKKRAVIAGEDCRLSIPEVSFVSKFQVAIDKLNDEIGDVISHGNDEYIKH